MIHIITSHHATDFFLKPQLYYLKKYLKQDFKLWGYVDIPVEDKLKKEFHYISEPPETFAPKEVFSGSQEEKLTYANGGGSLNAHWYKFNSLIYKVLNDPETKDSDYLITMDGDAFPISPLDEYIDSTLKHYKFSAIQRLENGFDIQPHSSFSFTTVGLFKEIKGTWSQGYQWSNTIFGCRTDVGGDMLQRLLMTRTLWYPLHRTNKNNPHPVFFGFYDNVIYHHGAGFRGRHKGYTVNNLKNMPQESLDRLEYYANLVEEHIETEREFKEFFLS